MSNIKTLTGLSIDNTQASQSTSSRVAILKFWGKNGIAVQKNGTYPDKDQYRILGNLVNGAVNVLLTKDNSTALLIGKNGEELPLGHDLACGKSVVLPVVSNSTVSLTVSKAVLDQLNTALLEHKVVEVQIPIEKDSYSALTSTPYGPDGVYYNFSVNLGHVGVEQLLSLSRFDSNKEYEANVIPEFYRKEYPEAYILQVLAIKSNDERAQLARYKAKTLSVPTPNTSQMVEEEEEVPVF